jgi:small subunit ribosomal protein S21
MKRGLVVMNTKDNIEVAIRKFKKKVADSGVLQELKDRQHYTKPTTKKKIAKNQAKNRWKRYLESQELPVKLF